jgi:hypothetical protein
MDGTYVLDSQSTRWGDSYFRYYPSNDMVPDRDLDDTSYSYLILPYIWDEVDIWMFAEGFGCRDDGDVHTSSIEGNTKL